MHVISVAFITHQQICESSGQLQGSAFSYVLSSEESEKAGSKLNIQKTKIMASGPIASWQIDGETMETVTHFIFLGSKITADGACSHKIKTLALWKKSYAPPRQHIQKQRH